MKCIRFQVRSPARRDECADLCEGLRLALVRSHAEVVLCDCSDVRAELDALCALARLRLTAMREGADLRLQHASVELRQLIELAGLATVIPTDD